MSSEHPKEKIERRKPDWWRLEKAITKPGPFSGMQIGSRSQVTLHHVVETTINVSHFPNQAVKEAQLLMEHKLGNVVDEYDLVHSEVDEIAPIHEEQRAAQKLSNR